MCVKYVSHLHLIAFAGKMDTIELITLI